MYGKFRMKAGAASLTMPGFVHFNSRRLGCLKIG